MKVFKVILVIVLIGILGTGLLLAQEDPLETDEPILLLPTFGEAPNLTAEGFQDYSSRFANVAEIGLSAGATDAQKLEAAFAIYRVGCYTYFTVPYRAERSFTGGYGGVPDDTVGGCMEGYNRSFKIHSGDAERPFSYYGYYEFYSQVSEVKGPQAIVSLKSIIAVALTNAEKECDAPEGRTHWQGVKASAVLNKDGGVATFPDKGISFTDRATLDDEHNTAVADGKKRGYDESWGDEYGLNSPEKTQHTINKNTIEPDSIELSKKTDKNGEAYYSVKFSVICNEESTGFEAQNIKSTASMIKAITYDYMIIELEVYQSGYMRRWAAAESWIGELQVLAFSLKGKTSTNGNTYISYDKHVVEQGINELWFGDYALL